MTNVARTNMHTELISLIFSACGDYWTSVDDPNKKKAWESSGRRWKAHGGDGVWWGIICDQHREATAPYKLEEGWKMARAPKCPR